MSEYISREEAEKAISIYANPNIDSKAVLSHVSSADVRPNIHGHWIKDEALSITIDMYKCSVCSSLSGAKHYNFCPRCGCCMNKEK